jgi:hypothetical protein
VLIFQPPLANRVADCLFNKYFLHGLFILFSDISKLRTAPNHQGGQRPLSYQSSKIAVSVAKDSSSNGRAGEEESTYSVSAAKDQEEPIYPYLLNYLSHTHQGSREVPVVLCSGKVVTTDPTTGCLCSSSSQRPKIPFVLHLLLFLHSLDVVLLLPENHQSTS